MNPLTKTDRQNGMARQWRYYNGQPDPSLRSTQRVNDNLPLPMARVIVDKGVSFLFGRDVQSQIVDGEGTGPQEWLDECWRRNKRGILLQKFAQNGGLFGHGFLRLIDQKPYPRVIVLDPQMVDVVTDPDDVDVVWQYIISQPDQENDTDGDGKPDDVVRKRTLISDENAQSDYGDDDHPRWVIYDQEYRGDADKGTGDWVTLQEQQWPYPFAPIQACQNMPKANDYWGESDVPDDVLSLIDGINRVTSHYNKIIRLHAHPKVYTSGMGSQKLDLSADSITHLPSETAKIGIVEMQSDLTSTMALLEKLLSLLSYAVRIPLIALGQPDGTGALSGVSVQLRYQPLMEKTEAKRLTYGDLLTETDRCLLSMGGFGDATLTQQVWPELLPKDPIQEREAFILDDQLGIVSKETTAEALGYDWDQEQKRRAAEALQAVDAMPMPLIPGQRPDNVTPQDRPGAQPVPQAVPAT